MTFESWLKKKHNIDHMTFTLRHSYIQAQLIEEWNQLNRKSNMTISCK